MQVTINGVAYLPASLSSEFGVGVTTLNRPGIVADTIDAIVATVPKGTPIVVVDDGSTGRLETRHDGVKIIRHENNRGIPASKNRCIEELMQAGVNHLFLFDDDCRPVEASENNWWTSYIESPEHHLQFSWLNFSNGTPVSQMQSIYADSFLVGYTWSMGCMLYVSRKAVETVGGMRLEFGRGMEEHAEWSQRIHNAGLTTFVHQDIPRKGLFYSLDENQSVARSFQWEDRAELLLRNEAIRIKHQQSSEYIEYRNQGNEVITAFLAQHEDPQRGSRWKPDPNAVVPLANSIHDRDQNTGLTVLTDCLDSLDRGEIVKVESVEQAYRQRWVSYYQYLRDRPAIGFAWLVDATDVLMLNDPFGSMQPGTLYTGYEPKTVGTEWIWLNGKEIENWIEENKSKTLLNTGLVGGDRPTLIKLCRLMNRMWCDYPKADAMHEMAFFNHVVYEHFPQHVTGPQVCTVFKSNATSDPVAWWAHK